MEGRLSYSKARAITRAASAATESYLLEMAHLTTAAQLEHVCKSFRTVCDEEARCIQAVENHQRPTVHSWTTPSGSMMIQAELPAEEGALVLAGLEATTRELRAEREAEIERANEERAARKRQAATAGAEDHEADVSRAKDVPAGTFSASSSASAPTTPPFPTSADALVALAASALVHKPVHAEGPESTRIVLHIDERVRTDPTVKGACHIEGVGVVPVALADRLACDASIRTVRYTQGGIELSAPTRDVPERLRRALWLRDGGCRFPSCTARSRLHAHHVVWWSKNGPTKIDNLCLLCSYHHHLVHEGGFGLTMSKDGMVQDVTPDGREVPDAPASVVPFEPPKSAAQMPFGGESFKTADAVDAMWWLEHPPSGQLRRPEHHDAA
jgi:hypothetical protein